MEQMTSNQARDMNRNPAGKGGFKDNPENINRDGRPKNDQRFGYWLPFFKSLTSKEFVEYGKEKKQDDMFVAELIAYERVKNSRKDLGEYKDLADRTEGKAPQSLELTGKIEHQVSFEEALNIIRDDPITNTKPEESP